MELPYFADSSRDEVSRAVDRFAKQDASGLA
jgi:hypothetical protein